MNKPRGYFGIGIINGKTAPNMGTLFRSAHIFGAAWIFTVCRRYTPQPSDTSKAWRSIPMHEFHSVEHFLDSQPREAMLVGVELVAGATPLRRFVHPERAVYILGAEDSGIPKKVIDRCHHLVQLPGEFSLNVAVAGSILMYDRTTKGTP